MLRPNIRCDRLTISPALLEKIANCEVDIVRKLSPETCAATPEPNAAMDEKAFRWSLNCDAMATEKLAEGIRGFSADAEKLEAILLPLLDS